MYVFIINYNMFENFICNDSEITLNQLYSYNKKIVYKIWFKDINNNK